MTRRVAAGSFVVGLVAGVAVVGLWLTGTGIGRSEVVSGDLADSLLDLALTGCAFGAIVLLARWPRASSAITAMAPVRAVGALALTSYVLHVVLIAVVTRTVDWQSRAESWPLLAGGVLVGTVLACWMWWRLVGRGPVERLMAIPTDRIV
nr:DUF418 domain-containing protein [Janibacter cremeus]